MTKAGAGEVVQFARTHGCEARLLDLSSNNLDDDAALSELTRLVKNYSTFASQNFLSDLLLASNNIGKTGAARLIQYAHWERDRAGKDGGKAPPMFKIDL